MFYVAVALLLRRGLAFSSHGAVIARYGQEFARTGALDPCHHRYLIEAFRTRQVADYEYMEEVALADAQTHTCRAGEFLEAARRYLTQGEEERAQ